MPIELSGRLDEESLEQIFALLTEQDIACSLLVSDGVSEKIFYFSIGGIRLISIGERKGIAIGEVLIQQGVLDSGEQDRILERMTVTERMFGETGVELGLLTLDALEAGILRQVEGELCDLFLWPDAEFEFREGQPPPQFYEGGHRACALTCDVPEFILGVQERHHQWASVRHHLHSDLLVLNITPSGRDKLKSCPDYGLYRVLSLVDGERRVQAIIEEADLAPLLVYEYLYSLLSDGLITKPQRGVELSNQLSREEILEEIAKLERARDEMVGDLIVLTRLAKAYEKINNSAKAAKLWKDLGTVYHKKGDLKQALSAYRQAVRCTPEDLNIREKILEIYRAKGEKGKVLKEGHLLAETLFKNNLLNRARQHLEALVKLAPGDIRIRKLLALTLLGLGDEAGALVQLKELARLLEMGKATDRELREIYRRILALDKGNRVIRRKLLMVSGRRQAIWVARAVIGGAIVLFLVCAAIFTYEFASRAEYGSDGVDLENLLLSNRFDDARRHYRDFISRYPWSASSRKAQLVLIKIEQRESEYLNSRLKYDFMEAKNAEHRGDFKTARELYTKIGALDAQKDPRVQEARDRASSFVTEESAAENLIRKGIEADERGDRHAALRIYKEARSMYPRTLAVRAIDFPVEIRSVPSGARVFLNGVEAPEPTPTVIHYSLASKCRVRLEMPGFDSFAHDVQDAMESEHTFFLQRKTRWVFTCGGPVESSPVIRGDTLYVTCRDRYLYAVDLGDGSLKFRTPLGIYGDSGASVAMVGDAVIVGTRVGEVTAIDANLGQVLWRRDAGGAVSADIIADPKKPVVYVTETGGRVLALDAKDGKVLWTADAEAAPDSSVAVHMGQVYVGSYDRRQIRAFSAIDGSRGWERRVDGPVAGSVTAHGNYVGFGCDDRQVYVLSAVRKSIVDSFRVNAAVKARPLIHGESVFFGSVDRSFYCFRVGRGDSPAWSRRLGPPGAMVLAGAAISGNRVYVGCTNGTLFCLDTRQKGKDLWQFQTGGKIVSRPVIADGVVYVTSTNGKVYAIEE
ncbi:MAG: outer membrane protein assembly factor BamB family protein [Planctomycetota bacterium]|jgi:outer membrane protein assembly factor BamB/tetratricopeptide (TPR) repeat protein